ncbi:hypothetical protein [uncultured Pelagimonas sp.]|uniref:hypothetical protein n=1 Tax=uncultured Pelagimonas sp. TaxID=1618102 RepID=UPI00262BAE83|nr:hypothetical protein [uncultured Pelagimonas sp.]
MPSAIFAQDQISALQSLISDPGRGFTASQNLLDRSFAQHLHSKTEPLTLQELDQMGAAYDPTSDSAFTAGMLYYHLAYPVVLLRKSGVGGDEIIARVIEARIRWLAGDTKAARFQIEDLITQFAAVGGTEDQMVSLLADAAVLAWRDGDTDIAQGYFTRAQACGEQRCPRDFVFDWLGPKRKALKQAFADYDADLMRQTALTGADVLVASPAALKADITQEADFTKGAWSRDLAWAIDAAKKPDNLPIKDKRRIRLIADRMLSAHGMSAFLMNSASVSSEISGLMTQDGDLSTEALLGRDVAYLGKSLWRSVIIGRWPILHDLYLASDRPQDMIFAKVIKARLVLQDGDMNRALGLLNTIVADTRRQGFSDAQLHAILMDQWASAVLAGNMEIAAQAKAAVQPCLQTDCDADIVASVATRYYHLPKTVFSHGIGGLTQTAADHFFREVFPGNLLKLADLYSYGSTRNSDLPLDSARDSLTGFEFAEQVEGLDIADLIDRATSTMDDLLVAGNYQQALEIGDRAEARARSVLAETALSAHFFAKRARAASRLGHPRTEELYQTAVARLLEVRDWDRSQQNLSDELALDLLDTRFDATLLALIKGRQDKDDIRARVEFRRGNHVRAADIYRAFRHRYELQVVGVNVKSYQYDSPKTYARDARLRAMALQEAHYRSAMGDTQTATQLQSLGTSPDWPAQWPDLNATVPAHVLAHFNETASGFAGAMSQIRPVYEFRDSGNYQGAAAWMRDMAWVAQGAEQSGTYGDAQVLWQMAFTFARAGETSIAFDLMDRAAHIAAALSFEGASEGTLQLLERDRWRYLLFVDIAWAAMTGTPPDKMLVVSRY